MSEKIDKSEIENNLISELSKSDIEIDIDEINKYKNPENKNLKINILKILNSYYNKLTYEIMITYLSELYINDVKNKFQNKIQDLVDIKREIYGGANTKSEINANVNANVNKTPDDEINLLLTEDLLKEFEKNLKKIENIIKSSTEAEESLKMMNDSYQFTPPSNIKDIKFDKYEDYNDNSKLASLTSQTIELDEQRKTTNNVISIHSQLKSKKQDIEGVIKKLNNNLNKFLEKQKENKGESGEYYKKLNSLIEPYENFIKKIKEKKELQEYPIIKDIYNDYINYEENNYKDDNDKEKSLNPKKYINDFLKENREIIEDCIENADFLKSKFQLMIESFEQTINKRNKDKTGGNKILNIKGGRYTATDIETKKKRLNDIKNNNKLNNLILNLKKIKGNVDIKKNPNKLMAASDFVNNDGSNLFDTLLKSYDRDYNNANIPHQITKNMFYNKVKSLNLDPEEELKISLNDKIIFIISCYLIRLGALYICYYLIDNNNVTNIQKILVSYIIWYVIIFAVVIFIVNIDTFKLRILMNYMNLHINLYNMLIHVILMIIFIYLIYTLIVNINGYDKPQEEISENEKIKLKYKLDLLTIIIYIFICILLFII
jgi:hypothetical protein